MRHSHSYIVVIMALATVALPGDQARETAQNHHPLVGHASHGLRAVIDPETGEYTRRPEPAPQNNLPALSGTRLFVAQPAARPLIELGSARAGGGFTIDLRERFRPTRHKPDA